MGSFSTTRWSLVLSAQEGSRLALAELLRNYWHPLYAFARRSGHSAADAQDLVQGYFLRFVEKDFLASVDADRGRFRSFLLASFKHFAANVRDREGAQKRGGDRVALDFDAAEARYRLEPEGALDAEQLYDRRWAMTVLERALVRLEAAHAEPAARRRYEHLKGFLTSDGDGVAYGRIARELGIEEGAVKVAVHRLRQRLGDALRAELAETAAEGVDLDEELRALLAALAAR
jgi:RNA polymerase sigma-70 factor (ECF subfamily)